MLPARPKVQKLIEGYEVFNDNFWISISHGPTKFDQPFKRLSSRYTEVSGGSG